MRRSKTATTPARTDHDQLFKRFIQANFAPTMRLFFPAFAAKLRLDQVRFITQEYFADFPEGSRHVMDLVAEVETLEGTTEIILLLCEIEYDRRAGFPKEMYGRYQALRSRRQEQILPLALYLTTGARRRRTETYKETTLGCEVMRFRFPCIGIRSLNGIEYREREQPVGAALAALMPHPGEDRVQHKLQCLLQVGRGAATDADRALLQHMVETYLPLGPAEEEEFQTMLQTEPYREIDYTISPYEQRGIQIGEQRGIEIGEQRGIQIGERRGIEIGEQRGIEIGEQRGIEIGGQRQAQSTLLRALRERFGEVPEGVRRRIEAADGDWCTDRTLRLFHATSLNDLDLA